VATVAGHRDEFAIGMRRNVQTNEIGRAAVIASAFSLIAQRHGLAVDQLEIGASGGLMSQWYRYGYETGESFGGAPDSSVQFGPEWWTTPLPSLQPVAVARRRAVDITPIDVTTADGRL
ncbi:MAG TPA: DUF2332 family protein, partial [Ilumatobacteraceae bacterium]|nr:DUF2332 family protein [Ilumatobacteraceae bacterium]